MREDFLEASTTAWYAIRVKSRCEKTVSEQLRAKGIEEFLPLYWSRRLWSDRVKVLQMPLFSGYLFSRFDATNRLPVLEIPGVALIVSRGKIPIPVPDEEVESIRIAVQSGRDVQPWPRLEVGRKVRVERGPLRGARGTLLQYKGKNQLIVGVELMQRALAVEVEDSWVMPVDDDTPDFRTLQAGARS